MDLWSKSKASLMPVPHSVCQSGFEKTTWARRDQDNVLAAVAWYLEKSLDDLTYDLCMLGSSEANVVDLLCLPTSTPKGIQFFQIPANIL